MKILIILTVVLIHGCTGTDTATSNIVTALEGRWSSICVDQSFGGLSGQTGSNTIVINYHGNQIDTSVNTYFDTGCTQLESTVEASQSTLFVSPENVPESFTIGNEIKSSNGVDVTEIDMLTVGGNVSLNIFLIQDSGTTLYFGISACPINDTFCGLRSTEINYVSPYTKINET